MAHDLGLVRCASRAQANVPMPEDGTIIWSPWSQAMPERNSTGEAASAACLSYLGEIMPRYYFHVQDGTGLDRDHIGADLRDLDEVHMEARKVARELCALWDDLPPGDLDKMAIEVVDDSGQPVLVVPFSEATEAGS